MLMDWFWRRPGAYRRLANFWPPLFFSGIALTEISKDWRFCRCKLKNWPGTRNFNGTQFGGSLFAMTDPVYSIMLKGNLGSRYYVWDKEARIDFVKPGVGSVFVESSISDELLRDVLEQTADGEKFFPQIVNVVYDKKGNVVAVVRRKLYVRLKRVFRPDPEKARAKAPRENLAKSGERTKVYVDERACGRLTEEQRKKFGVEEAYRRVPLLADEKKAQDGESAATASKPTADAGGAGMNVSGGERDCGRVGAGLEQI